MKELACTWNQELRGRLREEHRLMVRESRVIRRVFGPEGEEIAGGWRGCCNA
jgi:hypothetical protein